MTHSTVTVFKGNLFHCLDVSSEGFQMFEDALIGVNPAGTISFVGSASETNQLQEVFDFSQDQVIDLGRRFLIPGLVDTHIHAPQYAFSGTGTDLQLLKWLERYTFPVEAKYADLRFAQEVYQKVIHRTLSNGTTTACYYATIHCDASKLLADLAKKFGQRAFIGKVCMDRNSPANYVETTESSLEDTERFIQYIQNSIQSPLITPVITPRFVPSCSSGLMKGLGELARKYKIPIQSHICENRGELSWVKELHPEHGSYSQVYDAFGLLENSIMAHGIYLSNEELNLFQEKNARLCHCPLSNFTLKSGILDVRNVLNYGIKIGLGTDVSGGYSSSLLDAIRSSLIASNTLQFSNENYVPLDFKEAFALATLGGAQVLGLEEKIGNFFPGKSFDASIIDPYANHSNFDLFECDSTLDAFQKFIFLGDNRNISEVFVNGKAVIGSVSR